MPGFIKCSRCRISGHNSRTCKFTDAEVKDMRDRRAKGEVMLKELRERRGDELLTSLIDGLNALVRIAGSDYWLEGQHNGGGVYLESSIELDLDGPEAVAIVVAAIAERIEPKNE